jgi:hypothetical protein
VCQKFRGPCLALGTTDRSCPDGWLGCRHPGRQKEKEEEPRSREAAVCCSGRCNCHWGRKERNKRPRPQGGNSGSCHVHPNSRHSTSECREIIKLAKRVSEQREQTSKDGSPPRCRPGKERVDDGDVATGERDLGYQSPEQVLKDILIGDSDSGDDTDHRKKLYVMYDGSWEPSQMPGIPREVIEHHLKIHPDAKPVSQKPWRQSVERQDFIRKEVRKLLDAGFIEEVHHPVWLANLVIVPKANGKLQMCIDYTSLNKACPKDPYPLPRIDQIMDSTSRCDLLSFLDAYSGFHQI